MRHSFNVYVKKFFPPFESERDSLAETTYNVISAMIPDEFIPAEIECKTSVGLYDMNKIKFLFPDLHGYGEMRISDLEKILKSCPEDDELWDFREQLKRLILTLRKESLRGRSWMIHYKINQRC
jgi:hypothetical protein